MKYIVYDEVGNILRTGSCPDSKEHLQAQQGEFVMNGIADQNTQYVNNRVVVNKEKLPLRILENSIEVPKGTEVKVDGVDQGIVETGLVEFDLTTDDKYIVEIEKFPYLKVVMEVSSEGIIEIEI